MVTSEERLTILKMIQDGKITAEQGMKLLESVGDVSTPAKESPTQPQPAAGRGAHFLRVQVTDTNTGKTRVNLRLPINVVTAGIKMGARFSPEVEGLEMNALMEHIRAGDLGKIVDITDDMDGEHVEVFLE